jgi:hypothetical protein
MSIASLRKVIIVGGVIVVGTVTMLGSSASACSYSKLDLDYCGAAPKSESHVAPLNVPRQEKEPSFRLPDTYPTLVAPRDSRGRPSYGLGITHKFGG